MLCFRRSVAVHSRYLNLSHESTSSYHRLGRIRYSTWKSRERRGVLLRVRSIIVHFHRVCIRLTLPPPSNLSDEPPFNNPAFDHAFSESFLNFVMALDPNVKADPTDITPHWNTWNQDETEMLFNKTDATPGDPVVVPLMTSEALLGRCRCVFHPFSLSSFFFGAYMRNIADATDSFWESVAPFSGQ